VHNNYYFLCQVSNALQARLPGCVVSECFSQSKDELVIRFETTTKPFFIRASLSTAFACLSFPDNFQRARKNSVDLFPDLIGLRVINIRQFNNERSFAIHFTDDTTLLFKMHGNRSNIIVLKNDIPVSLFKNSIVADRNVVPNDLDRTIDWGEESYSKHHKNPGGLYFTFGKLVWQYLDQQNFAAASVHDQWQQILTVRQTLETPTFYITHLGTQPSLSLLPIGTIALEFDNPLRAANEFYARYIQTLALHQERTAALSALRAKLNATQAYYDKNFARLVELEQDNNYKAWADLLMANLHAIPTAATQATLDNFYNNNLPVTIKLRKDLSPQKNAEVYYRKAKNQHIEIRRLQELLQSKETEITKYNEQIAAFSEAENLKQVRSMAGELGSTATKNKQEPLLPYHEFEHQGYKIWVGRNAQTNDVLTFKHGYKEDLWLHAKDVAGSHVLIKFQAGKKFPKDVINRAAELAAYNSKRKTETLCPVIVTPRKFIRKRKGDPAGAVVIEREEVILVEPKLYVFN